MDLKWMALLALIIQNSGQSIVMRYTFLIAATDTANRYISSTAVLNAEIMKLIISLIASYYFDGNQNLDQTLNLIYFECVGNYQDFAKLLVPSVLYTVQNSLQYFSMSCLSAPVFQVLYQMKIITTAIFSVLLLSKRLTPFQWIAIMSLAIGVALVQLSQVGDDANAQTNSIAGLISVMLSCLTSGFAGVYFEMVLKSSKASIWLRNVQLSTIGIVMSAISVWYRDSNVIVEKGFFVGYNNWVWTVILLQAAGGLLVAMVVKYADNVLKGFATSLSIILSAIVSAMYFHDISINFAFVTGSMVVLASVYLYGYVPSAGKSSSSSSVTTSSSSNSSSGNNDIDESKALLA